MPSLFAGIPVKDIPLAEGISVSSRGQRHPGAIRLKALEILTGHRLCTTVSTPRGTPRGTTVSIPRGTPRGTPRGNSLDQIIQLLS